MRRLILFIGLATLSSTAGAQKDSTSRQGSDRHHARAWIVPIAIVASTAIDPELREWALHTHARSLDHLAHLINPLGTAHVLVPAMATFYAASLLTGSTSMQHGALETAAAYIVSDVAESILKPVVGRERPYADGNSHRFRPFTNNGDWHSFPSAHVTHITSIAEAISMQADSRPVSAVCDVVVALVSWDRIYEDEHWTSDVTATAALSALISNATVRWIKSRRSDH
ncbi:MAG: phosphatase PAP2 family protein [Gemmatimonadaceae bacterium]